MDLDHKEFLELDSEGGVIRFAGQREQLLDAVAMGHDPAKASQDELRSDKARSIQRDWLVSATLADASINPPSGFSIHGYALTGGRISGAVAK